MLTCVCAVIFICDRLWSERVRGSRQGVEPDNPVSKCLQWWRLGVKTDNLVAQQISGGIDVCGSGGAGKLGIKIRLRVLMC